MRNICVFCASATGHNPVYAQAARQLGKDIAAKDCRLIYGGGHVGLMGIVANAVLEAGGEVLGVLPSFLQHREVGHEGLTELIIVETMHERKMIMAEQAEAFVVLPGGLGTLDEMAEISTWRQLNIIRKPIGLLNINGYYDHQLGQFEKMVAEGFLSQAALDSLSVDINSASLLDQLRLM